MVAQNGQDVLIRVDRTGSREFQTIAGVRASKITLNSQIVDITHSQSAGRWRELLAGGGVRSASLTGSGVFLDEASDEFVKSAFFAGSLLSIEFVLPDFGIIEGFFQIQSLEYSGNYDGEVLFEMSFASAGSLHFGTDIPLAEESNV